MKRRNFLKYSVSTSLFMMTQTTAQQDKQKPDSVTLFVAGDVMTGRGIDQVLPHPSNPHIVESFSRSALDYVDLAEQANGPIPWPVDFAYIWGDALAALDAAATDVRIINLETAITRTGKPWPHKGIQYRMHPDNIPCLTAAGIDCCVLANNHVMDWGYAGLEETLTSLAQAGLTTAGAGADQAASQAPATLELPGRGRVLVYACGLESSMPGVNLLPDFSNHTVNEITKAVTSLRQPGDVVVASLHWGENWGYPIPKAHRRFAHALIDTAGVDLVHGHSSHHPLGIEVYQGRPILYGCGDLINDYEGISGHAEYRTELALLYLVTLGLKRGELLRLEMIPMRRQYFRLNHASRKDSDWLQATLDRESRLLGTRVTPSGNATLQLHWT